MTTPTVFVPQEAKRRNKDTGTFEPVHDLSPAIAFGDLEVLYSGAPIGFDGQAIVTTMKNKLKRFTDNDFIVATGDPAAIAVAVMVAASFNHGRVKLLRWDRAAKQYIKLQLDAR